MGATTATGKQDNSNAQDPLFRQVDSALSAPPTETTVLGLRKGTRAFSLTAPFDAFQRGLLHEPVAKGLQAEYLRVRRHLKRLKKNLPCVVYQVARKDERKDVEKTVERWLKQAEGSRIYVAIQRKDKITLLNPQGKKIKGDLAKRKRAADKFWEKETERRSKKLRKVLRNAPEQSLVLPRRLFSTSNQDQTPVISWLRALDQCCIRLNDRQVQKVTSVLAQAVSNHKTDHTLPSEPSALEKILTSKNQTHSLEDRQIALLKVSAFYLETAHILPPIFSGFAEALIREAEIVYGKRTLQ